MVGGIDISKGPSEGVGTGAIGGSHQFPHPRGERHRQGRQEPRHPPEDTPRHQYGAPRPPNSLAPTSPNGCRRSSFRFYGDTYSRAASLSPALIRTATKASSAYSKREQGNYSAGTNCGMGSCSAPATRSGNARNANSRVLHCTEVFNTSEDTESLLRRER